MRKQTSLAILGKMIGLVTPLTGHMLLAILFGTLGHLCAIAIPVLGAVAVLTALGFLPYSLQSIFITMLCCGLFRGIFAYVEQNRNHFIAFTLLALIRDKVFGALRKLCPAKLEGKERGDLIAIITADIELLEVFYAHTISPIAIAFLVGCVMTAFMAQFHFVFAITAALAYLITGIILPIKMSKNAQKLFAMQREGAGKLSSYYMDSLRGIEDITQLGAGEKRLAEIKAQTLALNHMMEGIVKEEGKVTAIADGLVLGFAFLMLCLSMMLAPSFPAILLPTIAMLSSFGPVLSLSRLSTGLSRVLAAGERVLALLEESPETEEVLEGETPDFTGIKTQNLSFSYGKEEILKDLSLSFQKGNIYGIYGKSGSGKSTLLKLLMGFWTAPKDSIRLSNVSLENIRTTQLRKLQSYMTQETDIFHTSIAENIRIGKLGATMEEVELAAKKASLHDFVMTLPHGYDTKVGELGDSLSGGERQRIGLARAFLHDAPLMLLDEPTSNLDSLNEAVILSSLRKEQENKTIILVSHRKSTLAFCDEMVTVSKGCLA